LHISFISACKGHALDIKQMSDMHYNIYYTLSVSVKESIGFFAIRNGNG